jgi:pilin isopeptide linkage protein
MKKFRKLLSMLLSAAMVCSISVMPAYATEDGGEGGTQNESESESGGSGSGNESTQVAGQILNNDGITSLPFTKVLKTNGAMILTDTTFEFTMVPDTPTENTKSNLPYQAGPSLGAKATETVTTIGKSKEDITTLVNANPAADGQTYVEGLSEASVEGIKLDGSFDLSGLTFEDAGIYRYVVQETEDASASASITYDTTKFIVDLWVNGDGNIYIIQSQLYATSEKKPLVFENSLKTSTIRIQKNVNGTKDVPEDTEYTFYIKIPTGGTSITLAENLAIPAKKYTTGNDTPTDVDSIKVGGTMEQEQSTATAKNTEGGTGWCSFTLKNGEYLEITGLPAGMVYYLFEQDYQDQGYVTYHKTVTGDSITTPAEDSFTNDDKGTDASGTTVVGKNGIFYLNTADIPANTGIILDVMPYVAIVLAAAVCALLFVASKRRRTR